MRGILTGFGRLLFVATLILPATTYADLSTAINDLALDGTKVKKQSRSRGVNLDVLKRQSRILITEDDYNYFPFESLTEEDSSREFELFLKDPRNAGLNYNLVNKFKENSRSKFLEIFILGESFEGALIKSGVDLSRADQWISRWLEQGRTFNLWAIQQHFIDFTNDSESLRKFNQTFQVQLEAIDADLRVNDNADFDDIGSLKNQSIGSELRNRLDHLIMFASQSSNGGNISSYHYGLVFAISIWMTRNILISPYDNGEDQKFNDQLSKIEHRKLTIMFQGVNLPRDFIIEGRELKSSVAATLLHVNKVFETNGLSKVQGNIESVFRPYLENQRNQIQQIDVKDSVPIKEFDQSYSNLQEYKNKLRDLESSVDQLLRSYGVEVQVKALQNRGQMAKFLATLARKDISPKDFDYLLDTLTTLSQTRLHMVSEIIKLNKLFNTIYANLKKSNNSSDQHKLYLKKWLIRYDQKSQIVNRKTYVEEVQSLFILWKDYFPDLIQRFKVAFQKPTSRCLNIFNDTSLKDMRVVKTDNSDAFSGNSEGMSTEYKRVACLLDYELELRNKYTQKNYSNLFDDGFNAVHYNLDNLAQEYSLASSIGSTSPANRSIYGMVHDLMLDRTKILLVTSKELKQFKSDVQKVLTETFLPLERQPVNSRGEFPVKLPKGILHSLSGELSDGGKFVDIVWEKPIPSPTFFGASLGICLGDNWLKKRDNSEKGEGSLELVDEVSQYMPKNAAITLLARRALLHKYNVLRKDLLKKGLISGKSSVSKMSPADTKALQYVKKMSEQSFIHSKPIHPVNIKHEQGSTWVGFGYGFLGDPTGVRPLVGQVQLGSMFHWEAVPPHGRETDVFIRPLMDFNYRSDETEKTRYGPIFNLYFPIYKLEPLSVSDDQFKIASKGFTKQELRKLFSRKIFNSQQRFNYVADDKNYFVRFSDSILSSGMLLMDAFANHEQHPPGISWKQKDISSQ